MSIELHPQIDVDKGTALEMLADDLLAVSFIGDDQGDLPAFDALDRLANSGRYTLRGAVASNETPVELINRADIVLEGPEGVLDLLQELAAA